MKVYEAIYNPMIQESSDCTLSIHRTRKGAQKVINKSKLQAKKDFRKTCEYYKKNKLPISFTWNQFKYWGVNETELLD